MEALFQWLLGAGREAALFVISMVPLVELRGAVPLGLGLGMPWGEVLPICYTGNILPIPFLLLFGAKLLKWLEKLPVLRNFSLWYQRKLMSKSGDAVRALGVVFVCRHPGAGNGRVVGRCDCDAAANAARAGVPVHRGGRHHCGDYYGAWLQRGHWRAQLGLSRACVPPYTDKKAVLESIVVQNSFFYMLFSGSCRFRRSPDGFRRSGRVHGRARARRDGCTAEPPDNQGFPPAARGRPRPPRRKPRRKA